MLLPWKKASVSRPNLASAIELSEQVVALPSAPACAGEIEGVSVMAQHGAILLMRRGPAPAVHRWWRCSPSGPARRRRSPSSPRPSSRSVVAPVERNASAIVQGSSCALKAVAGESCRSRMGHREWRRVAANAVIGAPGRRRACPSSPSRPRRSGTGSTRTRRRRRRRPRCRRHPRPRPRKYRCHRESWRPRCTRCCRSPTARHRGPRQSARWPRCRRSRWSWR